MPIQLTTNQAFVINNIDTIILNALANGVNNVNNQTVISAIQNFNQLQSSVLGAVKAPFESTLAAFLTALEPVSNVGGVGNLASIVGNGTTTIATTQAPLGVAVGMLIEITLVTGNTGWNSTNFTVLNVVQTGANTIITFSSSVSGQPGDPNTGEITLPGFSNGWINFGSGVYGAGFYKNQLGEVKLRGTIKGVTVGSSAFTLPSGYRPSSSMAFPVASNGSFGIVTIDSLGNVTPINPASNIACSLEGINFLADQ